MMTGDAVLGVGRPENCCSHRPMSPALMTTINERCVWLTVVYFLCSCDLCSSTCCSSSSYCSSSSPCCSSPAPPPPAAPPPVAPAASVSSPAAPVSHPSAPVSPPASSVSPPSAPVHVPLCNKIIHCPYIVENISCEASTLNLFSCTRH